MGTEAKKKADRRHLKKLFGGRHTAEEVHQQIAWGGARCICGAPAAIRIRLFTDASNLKPGGKYDLMGMRLAMQYPDGRVPCVDFKGPGGVAVPHVRVSDMYACAGCRTLAERTAAHPPQGFPPVVVEIDRGPGPDKPVVQVG